MTVQNASMSGWVAWPAFKTLTTRAFAYAPRRAKLDSECRPAADGEYGKLPWRQVQAKKSGKLHEEEGEVLSQRYHWNEERSLL